MSMNPPVYLPALLQQLEAFKQYLLENGWHLLSPCSEWEVLRYRGANETRIIFKNKHDRLSWTNESWREWRQFRCGLLSTTGESASREEVLVSLADLVRRSSAWHITDSECREKAQLLFDQVISAHHNVVHRTPPAKPSNPVLATYKGRI